MGMCRYLMMPFFLFCADVVAAAGIETIANFPVHKSNLNVFSTPVALRDGHLFTVNIELSGENKLVGLVTVLRHYVRGNDEKYSLFNRMVIEDKTINDPYHTQASVGLDESGYVHVAYNMHNMPWQYKRSASPLSISNMKFYGQKLNVGDRLMVKVANKTNFPSLGSAAIPGNQITYPAFFNDRNNKLYLSYRFALRPDRPFRKRDFAGAIAHYEVSTQEWKNIGGPVAVGSGDHSGGNVVELNPFIYHPNSAVYLPRLFFDTDNTLHVSWFWRLIGAGADVSRLSYAYSKDKRFFYSIKNRLQLPIGLDAARVSKLDARKYSPLSSLVVVDGTPYIGYQRYQGKRFLTWFDSVKGRWVERLSPNGASIFMAGKEGVLYAFATGVKVLKRSPGNSTWKVVAETKNKENFCHPKVINTNNESFIIHATSCTGDKVEIYTMEWN